MISEAIAHSALSCCFWGGGYGSLAFRQVAKRANLAWCGAHVEEETDEIEEAREDREDLSDIIDSGEEDRDEVDGAKEGRRPDSW